MPSSAAYAKHPDHAIDVTLNPGQVLVSFNGVEIARTSRALNMKEGSYPAVLYIPFADCSAEHFTKTGHTTHCPFKGDASYWTLSAGGEEAENAVWGYETPFDQVSGIAGHVAFYPDKVEIAGA